ncbi:MAG: tRNA (adenosine(37)-N6)-threonylcarbamoyltransferase complex dimerization subunit type 1 TsaB [Desulfohalobiaceae bacterium]|nr:tRNA (adenosine(37)-N6)-threonylcarbamoyltransferase complex dimerization subunit type 1 TsaB [Desulfohalobiaceae bacterium]
MTSSASSDEIILALNAAEDRLQAVLGKAGELFCSREVSAPSRGITLLPRAVQQCLEEAGPGAKDIDRIACVRGPGAFTGLRIALSYALGLARSLGLPQCGLDYLPLIAEVPARTVPGELWVMTRARINTVYLQGFIAEPEHGVRAVSDPAALFLEQAARILESRGAPLHLVGSGLRENQDYLVRHLSRARFLDRIWDKPCPDTLLAAASRGTYTRDPIEPSYMRPSDAEADLPRIAAQRGVDPSDWSATSGG